MVRLGVMIPAFRFGGAAVVDGVCWAAMHACQACYAVLVPFGVAVVIG